MLLAVIDLLAVIYYTTHIATVSNTMQKPFSVLYEVFETNADLEEVRVVHQGYVRDIAETKMFLLFRLAGYGRDYMLINRNNQEMEVACFTTETIRNRNECQG